MRRSLLLLAFTAMVGWSATAVAGLATFDSFEEGHMATELVDNGIRFFDLDRRLGDPEYFFTIDRADGSELNQFPDYFSPPNVLGLGGWVPGPDVGYARCGEFKFSTGELATEARAEVFTLGNYVGNTVTMEAWLGGEVVATDSFIFTTTWVLEHHTLEIVGVEFDFIRIVGHGQEIQGCFFAVLDNVLVSGAVATELLTWGEVKTLFR
jgi:hypothetical protein